MNASKKAAKKLWAAAKVAAAAMTEAGAAPFSAYVNVGVKLPEEVARELAALAGVPLRPDTFEKRYPVPRWITIYAFNVGKYGTVQIYGQGDRPATPEEIAAAQPEASESAEVVPHV